MKKSIILLGLLLIGGISLHAQIALYPTAVFIDPQTRTGSMEVINSADEVREIDISLKFGYFTYDSLGNSITKYNDTIAEQNYSLIPYIKVFPQKLIIPPKAQQTIRFLIKNLPTVREGVYWTRLVAGSVPQTPQVDTLEKGKISAQIILRSEMVGLVAVISGSSTSDLDYSLASTFTDSVKFNLLLKQERTGNSPFWGSIQTEIRNSKNDVVAESKENLALYFSCNQKVSFDKTKFVPGKYTAKITVTNEREEVPENYRPNFKPKTKTFDFEIK